MAVAAEPEEVVEETTTPITETQGVEETPPSAVADVQSGDEGGADAQSGIDSELAALANSYGLDPASFGNDPDRVRYAVTKFDRQLAEFGMKLMQPKQEQQTAAPAKPPSAEFDLDKVFPGEILNDDLDPSMKEWTKSAKDGIKSVHSHWEQQLAAQMESLKQEFLNEVTPIKAEIQQRKQELLDQQVDGFFGALGKEWETEFGNGPIQKLPPHSPLRMQRQEVYLQALAIQKGYEQLGMQPPPMEEALKRGLHSRYADKNTTFTRQQIIQEAAKQKAVAVNSGRKRTAPASDKELAAQAFRDGRKQLQALGLMVD